MAKPAAKSPQGHKRATGHARSTAEAKRLEAEASRRENWKRWGPYLADRQWATVREDYSASGNPWAYFPHDHARSRAYRWGEDGLLGWTDRECRLCFGLALWNENDPILKERLFGLGGPEGNHGEDVKELYYYLDATPTHSYNRAIYKYPQRAFPYSELVNENGRRGKDDPEYEITDTGVFDDGRYFDIQAEYAKARPNDILIRLSVTNHGDQRAKLHLIPQLWFRNTWVWGCRHEGCTLKPRLTRVDDHTVHTEHETLESFDFCVGDASSGQSPQLLFTENETNFNRLFNSQNISRWTKDAFGDRIIEGNENAVNAKGYGTKVGAWYRLEIEPGQTLSTKLRLKVAEDADDSPASAQGKTPSKKASRAPTPGRVLGKSFDETFTTRINEARAFHQTVIPNRLNDQQQLVSHQAYASLLWTRQFYHYVVEAWLEGDPNMPTPPPGHRLGRNLDWQHLYARDVLSMPDKWEYPWFAAWDTAFHMLPLCRVDPADAKKQLMLFLREWYMHPNGQIPAYEFSFSDVNPPVHAWACWRVYKMTAPRGKRDSYFLASAFQKLLLNFTWWVNRKDPDGNHVFAGGFLGLDNIGVFDRNTTLPGNAKLSQADGTAWMAFYCVTMLAIGLELGEEQGAYADMGSKFFEHFIHIASAINTLGGRGLWDEEDGFYYDQIRMANDPGFADGVGQTDARPIKVRSLVGLLPIIAVEVLDVDQIEKTPGFKKRMDWFIDNEPDLANQIVQESADGSAKSASRAGSNTNHGDDRGQYLLAIPSRDQLVSVLGYLLDENEFLSPFGIRSLSKYHEDHPYTLTLDGQQHTVSYEPGVSRSQMFGGNSNWRGPVWFPVNYLIIEALQRYHHFYGDELTVECPTGSGHYVNLRQAADEIQRRLARLFLPQDGERKDKGGPRSDGAEDKSHAKPANDRRPCHGPNQSFKDQPGFQDLILYHEFFHAETGQGLGASHQTGWTALITNTLEDLARP